MMNYFWGKPAATTDPNIQKRRLRVRIGPTAQTLTVAHVNNDSAPHFVDSPHFMGHVVVRVKNFDGVTPDNSPPVKDSAYFGTRRRLFSIQVSGRFKQVLRIN
jgi:hypothetical protein